MRDVPSAGFEHSLSAAAGASRGFVSGRERANRREANNLIKYLQILLAVHQMDLLHTVRAACATVSAWPQWHAGGVKPRVFCSANFGGRKFARGSELAARQLAAQKTMGEQKRGETASERANQPDEHQRAAEKPHKQRGCPKEWAVNKVNTLFGSGATNSLRLRARIFLGRQLLLRRATKCGPSGELGALLLSGRRTRVNRSKTAHKLATRNGRRRSRKSCRLASLSRLCLLLSLPLAEKH